MKLRNKLLLYILQSILIVIVILGILFNFIFDNNFNSYLSNVREERFEQIKTQIGILLKKSDINTLSASLGTYALMEDIEIEVFDENGKSLVRFNPLLDDKEIIQKSYGIQEGEKIIGSINISYYNDGFFDDIARGFKKNIFISLLIAGLIAIISGLLASIFISKKMSTSINDIRNLAMNYKNEKYEHVPINTDIKELSDLVDNMNYLGDSLNRQELLRKQYAQDISHELRTPLTNLQLQIEAINDGIMELDESSLKSIKDEILHLNKLIEQLKLSFDESSALSKINKSVFDLSKLIIDTNRTLSTTANNYGMVLKSDIKEDVFIESDPDKIVQVLYNLISNAFKASNPGDIVLVRLLKINDIAQIYVIDEGIGIPQKDINKIFDRFFKVDTSRNSEYGGSGLGLAITKKMVESLGGKIKVESQINKGTTFIIELPALKKPVK